MHKIFMVVNEDRFFLSHRKDIALYAQKRGYEITLVAKNTGRRNEVEALGLKMIELPINPTGENIKEELKTFRFLMHLYRQERPDIVHHVGLKNILWGGLAARLTSVHGVVNAVSGLGILFSQEKQSVMQKAILSVIRFSCHRKNVATIFQNEEDRTLFIEKNIIRKGNVYYTRGSGVDLKEYTYMPEPKTPVLQIIFTARMVAEKGVKVLIEAAEKLKDRYNGKVRFLLCGGLSSNPLAIQESYLKEHCDGKYICWLGHRSDIKKLLEQSHIMCFPSYYREGVPKSLIEAAAIGRPIVTTDSIGCKDTVIDGYNGFLVPVKDSDALVEKLTLLIEDGTLRQMMGINSREMAEKYFSIDTVIAEHMKVYENLLKD